MTCLCDFPENCDGGGMLYCEGCGGDNCICTCGGEAPCGGCDACLEGDGDEDDT